MEYFAVNSCWNGLICSCIMLFTICSSTLGGAAAVASDNVHGYVSSMSQFPSVPGSGLFDPIDISPAVIPHFDTPEQLSPMYPTFPTAYKPVLTGRCPVEFSALSNILDKTACDCFQNFAAIVRISVCCPQFSSLVHIIQGYSSARSSSLVLRSPLAGDCFEDVLNILASRQANHSISAICSITSSTLTGGSCPVTDVGIFENTVNTQKLSQACGSIDPLKECCQPTCQTAIDEAAFQISGIQSNNTRNNNRRSGEVGSVLNDCKGVVHSWLAGKLPVDVANTAFRVLSSCKVNKVCPLDLREPTGVIKACRNITSPRLSCCSSLNTYMSMIQKQMLITNKQAIICAATLGAMLRGAGVQANIYEHCDVDLKDFSVQRCLLRSPPTDMIFDESTGLSFMCDLSDSTAGPWSTSASFSPVSFCATEMSLPALPATDIVQNNGDHHKGFGFSELIVIYSVLVAFFRFYR